MNLFGSHPSEQDLALFAGGELGPLSRWRIERHLESCAACKTEAADYFHLSDKLSALAELPPVDWKALAHNIQVAASQTSADRAPQSLGWVWKIGAAAATAICLTLLVPTVREDRSSMNARLETAAPLQTQAEQTQGSAARVGQDERVRLGRENSVDPANVEQPGGALQASGRQAPALSAETAPLASAAGQDALSTVASNEWSGPDAQITVEGRLSRSSFDAGSGVMTITEYYVP